VSVTMSLTLQRLPAILKKSSYGGAARQFLEGHPHFSRFCEKIGVNALNKSDNITRVYPMREPAWSGWSADWTPPTHAGRKSA
jgi:hypothetical protein